MPEEFEKCARKEDSKIRTVTGPSEKHGLDEGEYVKYCIDESGTHRGHVKKKGKTAEAAKEEGG